MFNVFVFSPNVYNECVYASSSPLSHGSRNEKPTFYVPHQQPHDQVVYPILNSGYPYVHPYPNVYPYFY